MPELQTTVYTLPAHWASILINHDYTGTSDEEEQEISNFIDELDRQYDWIDELDREYERLWSGL
jgi:hypothetical protein